MYNFIKRMHPDTFTDENVQSFVAQGWITQEQADTIINENTAT